MANTVAGKALEHPVVPCTSDDHDEDDDGDDDDDDLRKLRMRYGYIGVPRTSDNNYDDDFHKAGGLQIRIQIGIQFVGIFVHTQHHR